MIDVELKQSWLEKSSEGALEEFKASLVSALNSLPEDRHLNNRWSISKISEGNTAHLLYDERPLLALKIENNLLRIHSEGHAVARYDEVLYVIRYVADRLLLAVYSNAHDGARLPQDCTLSLDHSFFGRDHDVREFFQKSNFIPRFARTGFQNLNDGRSALVLYSPYYAENKTDGSIHIINNAMLSYLSKKDNQTPSQEFSYKVADSMNDFARKFDLGLIPASFYQNYGYSAKIINATDFDVFHINRKVFINPFVWDFDDQHNHRYYKNTQTGRHLMDKVRRGETLDEAIKRTLREELKVAGDYIGARIWGIEFDRDREGLLTPRLKMNIFVHGLTHKHRSQEHDWVSLK